MMMIMITMMITLMVPQIKRKFANPLLKDSLSTSIAACFEFSQGECISASIISNHIAHTDFAVKFVVLKGFKFMMLINAASQDTHELCLIRGLIGI